MADPTYPGSIPPPPGVTPDLKNPPDAGRKLNIVLLIVIDVVVFLFFSLRVASKVWLRRKILVEDITCAVGVALVLLYSATCFAMIHYGLGYHQWDVSQHNTDNVLRWLYASSILFVPAAFFVKTTLLLLIARVFSVRRKVARAIYVFIGFVGFAYIPIQFCKIFLCRPIKSYWRSDVAGECLNQRKIFLADLSMSIFTDLVILIIPIPLTWSLSLSWKKKLKIVLLLAGGGLATGTTIYRLYRAVGFMNAVDVTSEFVALDILTITEIAIGSICACIPSANILIMACLYRSRKRQDSREQLPLDEVIRPPRPGRDKSSNFKTELAMWSGVQEDGARSSADEARASPTGDGESVCSADGRREGWLAPPGPTRVTDLRSTREISLELSRVSKNEPWERIWDGSQKA